MIENVPSCSGSYFNSFNEGDFYQFASGSNQRYSPNFLTYRSQSARSCNPGADQAQLHGAYGVQVAWPSSTGPPLSQKIIHSAFDGRANPAWYRTAALTDASFFFRIQSNRNFTPFRFKSGAGLSVKRSEAFLRTLVRERR